MKMLALTTLLASTAVLSACATVVPMAAGSTCGTALVDVNNDGQITGSEWNTYRTASYANWDVNRDGRISRAEFENCYRAGGFYQQAYYNPNYWSNYWTAFDANGDGYLSNDEYWSASTWTRIDRNNNGIIDSNEWVWWGS